MTGRSKVHLAGGRRGDGRLQRWRRSGTDAHTASGRQGGRDDRHISGGRFGLNIVAAGTSLSCDVRSSNVSTRREVCVAAEWATVVASAMGGGPFDFTVTSTRQALHSLRTVQSPAADHERQASRPGRSCRATRYTLHQAADLEAHGERAAYVRALAKDTFDREMSVMGMGYVVCANREGGSAVSRPLCQRHGRLGCAAR